MYNTHYVKKFWKYFHTKLQQVCTENKLKQGEIKMINKLVYQWLVVISLMPEVDITTMYAHSI